MRALQQHDWSPGVTEAAAGVLKNLAAQRAARAAAPPRAPASCMAAAFGPRVAGGTAAQLLNGRAVEQIVAALRRQEASPAASLQAYYALCNLCSHGAHHGSTLFPRACVYVSQRPRRCARAGEDLRRAVVRAGALEAVARAVQRHVDVRAAMKKGGWQDLFGKLASSGEPEPRAAVHTL